MQRAITWAADSCPPSIRSDVTRRLTRSSAFPVRSVLVSFPRCLSRALRSASLRSTTNSLIVSHPAPPFLFHKERIVSGPGLKSPSDLDLRSDLKDQTDRVTSSCRPALWQLDCGCARRSERAPGSTRCVHMVAVHLGLCADAVVAIVDAAVRPEELEHLL